MKRIASEAEEERGALEVEEVEDAEPDAEPPVPVAEAEA